LGTSLGSDYEWELRKEEERERAESKRVKNLQNEVDNPEIYDELID
jgi:hypothetical protein